MAQLECCHFYQFCLSNASYGPLDFTLQDVWLQESDHTVVVIPLFCMVIPPFLQFICAFLPPLFNFFCFYQVLTISVLPHAHPCMKYSPDVSNFLEELSRLPHSIFSSTSLHCSFKKAFLSLLVIFWNCAFNWVYIFPFILCLFLLSFPQLCVKPTQTTTLPSSFFFLWDDFGHCLLYSVMNLHPQFFRHSVYQM